MMFSVIFSVDVPRDESIQEYLPRQRHLFRQTEGDSSYALDYLEGPWKRGKHRKLCAVLNRKQFDTFLSDTCLFAEDVETMGSIGAPGLGFGLAPAISFTGEYDVALCNAYVTPFPAWEPKRKHTTREENWERIRQAVLSVYG